LQPLLRSFNGHFPTRSYCCLNVKDNDKINWADKRINQADKSKNVFMLAIANETGCFKEAELNRIEQYRATMSALQNNRNEQDAIMNSLKIETL